MSSATAVPGVDVPGVGPMIPTDDLPPVVRNDRYHAAYTLWHVRSDGAECVGEFATYTEARDVGLTLAAGAGRLEVYGGKNMSDRPLFRRTVLG